MHAKISTLKVAPEEIRKPGGIDRNQWHEMG